MILLFILLIPIITGLLLFLVKNTESIRYVALISTLINLAITLSLVFSDSTPAIDVNWIYFLGAKFSLGSDGISHIMVLLTNLLFPFIILAGFNRKQHQVALLNFLILLTQSALIGVFLAQNAFLFYVFWELALIPVYFILLLWGDENRRAVTLKFFIYTLAGSLFLLFGIIYLYHLTPAPHTTDFAAFNLLSISENTQVWLFWILFIAFAIKMPVFPFHTWQPSTYTMAPTQGVLILAGLMTKMGIYGALRFLIPVVPFGTHYWQNTVIVLCLTGLVYASIIAFRQVNLKKLIAFSSMAHISLMAAAIFAMNYFAFQGLMVQIISHGVIIVALFYFVDLLHERTGTFDLSEMGGIKLKSPIMALIFLLVVLGSIALPLTAGFVGEFLIITGLFQHSIWFAIGGGSAMVLGAIYMLYAYQRVMLGESKSNLNPISDMNTLEYILLLPLVAIILILGIYPQPIFTLIESTIVTWQHLFTPVATTLTSLVN